ncbi:MAG: AglZ/HisF2 family acetamidino modification protein [Saprospiraceae bacterium]|nr:AglZ/HisF2 family acetamidino modification protein [Saprospiraceae bacterium]
MFRPRIIPVLTVIKKRLVKTVKFKKEIYIGDPLNALKIFNEFQADEIIINDIRASIENRAIDHEFVRQVGDEAYMPVSVGGGVSNIQTVRKILNSGVEKVVLNSTAVLKPELVSQIAQTFGSQSIIISVDIKRDIFKTYQVMYNSGRKKSNYIMLDFIRKMEDMGAGEILINTIDRDGLMIGYDENLIARISSFIKIPVIACGGASNILDMVNCYKHTEVSALAAGSIFIFQNRNRGILINYPDRENLKGLFNA